MRNNELNITTTDLVKSYYMYIKHRLRYLSLYRKTYKDYLSVVYKVLRKKYPITGILRNGKKMRYNHYYEILNFILGIEYDYQHDKTSISLADSKTIIMHGCSNNGDIQSVFFDDEYRFLPVKDQIVLDIGANIGDTSIYFALKGAKKVYAIEPYTENCIFARKNITENNLNDKIELISAACSSKEGTVTISKSTNVTSMTLESIMQLYKINSGVLKIDCEGGEYDIILSSSRETLRKFSHIQIEYHHGYIDLKRKLEECGFSVHNTSPRFATHFYLNNATLSLVELKGDSVQAITNDYHVPTMYMGMLYATRK